MEISARRGIRIGLKRYALVVNSGVRVSCLEIWFQNPKAAACRTGGKKNAAPFQSTKRCSNALVVCSLPSRRCSTWQAAHFLYRGETRITGQNKRTLCRPADSGSQRPIHPALRRETGTVIVCSRASSSIIPPSPPVVNSSLRSS